MIFFQNIFPRWYLRNISRVCACAMQMVVTVTALFYNQSHSGHSHLHSSRKTPLPTFFFHLNFFLWAGTALLIILPQIQMVVWTRGRQKSGAGQELFLLQTLWEHQLCDGGDLLVCLFFIILPKHMLVYSIYFQWFYLQWPHDFRLFKFNIQNVEKSCS